MVVPVAVRARMFGAIRANSLKVARAIRGAALAQGCHPGGVCRLFHEPVELKGDDHHKNTRCAEISIEMKGMQRMVVIGAAGSVRAQSR